MQSLFDKMKSYISSTIPAFIFDLKNKMAETAKQVVTKTTNQTLRDIEDTIKKQAIAIAKKINNTINQISDKIKEVSSTVIEKALGFN